MYGYKFVGKKAYKKIWHFTTFCLFWNQLWKVCVSRLSNTKAKQKEQRNLDICSMVMKVVILKQLLLTESSIRLYTIREAIQMNT